eukprot:7300718-Karenia_brevis.AAC.1
MFVPHRRKCNAKICHSDLSHKDVGMEGECLPMHDLCEVRSLLLFRRLHANNLSIWRNQLAVQWKLQAHYSRQPTKMIKSSGCSRCSPRALRLKPVGEI